MQVSAKNCRCAIEVVNTSNGNGESAPDGNGTGPAWGRSGGDRAGAMAVTGDPVPDSAEHGSDLKIIDAVVDNLRLTGNERQGTIVHFEKTLDWLPGAAGRHLFKADGGR